MGDFLDRLNEWYPEWDYEFGMNEEEWAELEFLDAHAPSPEELIIMDANAEQLLADIEAENER